MERKSSNRNLFYRKPPGPCKDCTERYVGCQPECEKYHTWHTQETNINAKIYEAKSKESVTTRYEVERNTKYKELAKKKWRKLQ